MNWKTVCRWPSFRTTKELIAQARVDVLREAAEHVRNCANMVDSTGFQGQILRASLAVIAKEIEEL